jgi:hypothetical protein
LAGKAKELPGRNEEESWVLVDPAKDLLDTVLLGMRDQGRQRAIRDLATVPKAADPKEERRKHAAHRTPCGSRA